MLAMFVLVTMLAMFVENWDDELEKEEDESPFERATPQATRQIQEATRRAVESPSERAARQAAGKIRKASDRAAESPSERATRQAADKKHWIEQPNPLHFLLIYFTYLIIYITYLLKMLSIN